MLPVKVFFIVPDPAQIYATKKRNKEYCHLFTQRYLSCAKKYVYESTNNYVFITLMDEPCIRSRLEEFQEKHERIIPIWIPSTFWVHKPSEYLFGEVSDWETYSKTLDSSYIKGFQALSYKEMKEYHLALPEAVLQIFDEMYDLLPDEVYIRNYYPHTDFFKVKEFFEKRFEEYYKKEGLVKEIPSINVIGLPNVHFFNLSEGKGFLHSNEKGNSVSYLSNLVRENVPSGYYVLQSDGIAGIVRSIEKLLRSGIERVVLKPVFGSGGSGIFYVEKRDLTYDLVCPINGERQGLLYYTFPLGDIVVEEFIETYTLKDIFGNIIPEEFHSCPLSFSTHYVNDNILGNPLLQFLEGSEWVGNLSVDASLEKFFRTKGISTDIFVKMNHITFQYAKDLGLTGPLCLDFLVDKNNKVFLIDPNNRDTGDLGVKWVSSYLSIEDKSILLYNAQTTSALDLQKLKKFAQDNYINFVVNYYLPETCSLIIYDEDYKIVLEKKRLLGDYISTLDS